MCGLTVKFTTHARQRGFTLLEVLIAVIVLALGLLGLAKLQTAGLTANNIAYLRSQATILAYDAVDMIQADRNNAQGGCYDVDRKSSGSSCSPADGSIREWKIRLGNILPDGEGAITVREDGLHHVVTVQIWMLGYDEETGWGIGDDEPFVEVSSAI